MPSGASEVGGGRTAIWFGRRGVSSKIEKVGEQTQGLGVWIGNIIHSLYKSYDNKVVLLPFYGVKKKVLLNIGEGHINK